MSNFNYVALDPRGRETRGLIEVADQDEAIQRIREMGFFPTKILPATQSSAGRLAPVRKLEKRRTISSIRFQFAIGPKVLTPFTRQLATLIEAGLPLLRGLRLLREQETHAGFREILGDLSDSIEGGSTFSEALARHPRVFNRLYLNMVKAGELGGVLEIVLQRLADFMEKAQKIKGKVMAAMFYPAAVITVAVGIMGILMTFVVPKFRLIFEGLLSGAAMPPFTVMVLNVSEFIRSHFVAGLIFLIAATFLTRLFLGTPLGRRLFDHLKLNLPVLGKVIRKVAIARFSRTFGTLIGSGVPMLQALAIVQETAGNVVVGRAVALVHESVKEGATISAPMKASGVFPPVVVGMVDVGEQTGALPEMLLKIADNYDDEVDNAVSAMTSLLEPIMIVFLAVIVGSIVIALFLPLISIVTHMEEAG